MKNFRFEQPVAMDLPIYNRTYEKALVYGLKVCQVKYFKTKCDKSLPYYCFYTVKFITAGEVSNVFTQAGIKYHDLLQKAFPKSTT